MAGVVNDTSFVFFGRTKESEHWFLRSLDWIAEVESAVQHQHRYLYSRREVKFIHFRQRSLKIESRNNQDADRYPGFHRREHGTHSSAPTRAQITQLGTV